MTAINGLRITRRFTTEGRDPYADIEWTFRDSRITNPDGSIVFEMKEAEIPTAWSQVASDIMVSKYFRKAGVSQVDKDGQPIVDDEGNPVLGPEHSARQVFNRLAGTWRWWGERNNYFASEQDAQAFEDELKYMLATQMAAPNSPQWFNTGLNLAYGLTGPEQGFWFVDPETGEAVPSPDSYRRPSPHACFIQSVQDDLVNEGGIMDLWTREARLFKFGSGTGSNFSSIRAEGEPLSGGGKSSGVMSFLKIGDRAAGAIKSGGTTRRAAKMVILDMDHPDIEEFINWKKLEEEKAKLLIKYGGLPADFNGEAYQTVSGQNSNNSVRVTAEFLQKVKTDGDWELTERSTGKVRKTVKARDLWRKIAEAAWACADPGMQFHTTINEWHTSPAGGQIRASNPCFTGDTRIATDKGLIQFRDLIVRVADGETFSVFTHNATSEDSPSETVQISRPTQFMTTGTNEILKLEFSDGRVLRLTPNHRLWTANRGWVRADEVTEDDNVRLLDQAVEFPMASLAVPVSSVATDYQARSSRGYAVNLPEKWTEEFAHYVGWLVGDGSVTDKAAVTVYGTSEEQQTTMVLHRELLTEMNGGFAPKPALMGNGTYQLRATRLAIPRFLEALGVVSDGAKRVPWSIFEAPKSIVAAFLRGLFDADGTTVASGDKNRYVGLGQTSVELLQDVQQLLDTFGIAARIYRTREAGETIFTYKDEEVSYGTKAMHDLRITGTSLERFGAEIGFLLSPKQDRLDQLLVEHNRYRSKYRVRLRSRTTDGFETTYNLTEPINHSYIAGGVLAANCSEYMFLDDTACNLASLNLVTFYDDATGRFDIETYEHAIRLWTIVLEISVTMAHFPSKPIAQGSYDYRTLGLGYANLGSLLMRSGHPYDSDEGRAIAGALTAILTGFSYRTSAEMASVLGPFPKWNENAESMLRVIRNHRRAAYGETGYEGVSHFVMGIDAHLAPEPLLKAARTAWDEALSAGQEHGYRNAQVSTLAPTGTIGLLMDCDTTGVEPDFALVKFKKLAGGGYFKIANQSIAPSLRRLGYDEAAIKRIVMYVAGTMTLEQAPHINRESLREKGLSEGAIDRIDNTLPSVFELRHAFNVYVTGEDALLELGLKPENYTSPTFDLLTSLGFTARQISEANDVICGMQTIEGAPGLREEHLAVFDTANRNGRHGIRFIHHVGHIKMMAATQPFITGAISKTINMPNEVTSADIEEAYMMSADLGLKAMALYRDGSKASQPLSSSSDDAASDEDEENVVLALEHEKAVAWGEIMNAASPTQAYSNGHKRPRFLLPARRNGWTQEARIGGHKVFLRTGEYDDGTLGEVFIDLAKEGATLRGVLSCFAIAVSKGLQYGVPLEEFVDTFTFHTFEPRGMVEGHPNIKMANSIIDYVFRAVGLEYLGRTDLVQVKPQTSSLPEPPKGLATEAGIQLDLTEAAMEKDIEVQAKVAKFVDSEPKAPARQPVAVSASSGDVATASVQAALSDMMGDAPLCPTCGHITIRNGTCYKCLNCGDTTGCS